jgi:autotransporter-associated beta strand protein
MNGGTLVLFGGPHIGEEALTNNAGVLDARFGSNSWAGPVGFATTTIINVLDAGDFLNIAGSISGPAGFLKAGEGTLILSGTSANTYAGPSTVSGGVLALSKTGSGSNAIPAALLVGDSFTGTNLHRVRLLANNQIADGASVTINPGGVLDFNTNSDMIGPLTLTEGVLSNGLFRLNGDVFVGASSNVSASTIWSRLDLGSAMRTINFVSTNFANCYFRGEISGSGGIAKVGGGAVRLWASNSYSGLTIVGGGAVEAGNSFALGGTAGGTVVSNGASLLVRYGIQIGNESLALNGTGQGTGALYSDLGTNSWAGPVTLESDSTVHLFSSNDVLSLGNSISGPGGLSKVGAGTLIYGGANHNTYTGATILKEGILQLSKGGSARAIDPTFGSLIISNDVAGPGTVIVRYTADGQISSSVVPVTLRSSGLMDLNGANDTIGPLTLIGGRISTGAGNLTLGGDVTVKGTVNGQSLLNGKILLPATRTFLVTNAFFASDLVIPGSVGGAGGLTLTGLGGIGLSGSNSYLGLTQITGGCGVSVFHPFAFGSTNAGTSAGGFGYIVLFASVTGEGLTLSSATDIGALTVVGATNSWSGPITLANNTSVGAVGSANARLILTGPINGSGALTNLGIGTVEFAGVDPNTYTGTTIVRQGTLHLNKSVPTTAIAGPLIIGDDNGGADADRLRVGGNPQIGDLSAVTVTSSGVLLLPSIADSIGSLAGNGHVDIDGGVLEVGGNNNSSTFTGLITGSGGLTKFGTGTLTLEGNNSYTGQTVAQGGSLIINGSQPQSPIQIIIGGRLGGHGVVGNVIVGMGALVPGASPGMLTCSNLTLNGSGLVPADFTVELNGTIPGTNYDQVKVRGAVGFALARLTATLGFASAISNSFTIIDNDGSEPVTNTFTALPEGATLNVSGTPFRISYIGGDGNDVVLTQLTATQQPLLKIQTSSATNVVLSWATNFTGYSLEANTNLNANVWVVVSPAPSVSGTNNVVTNITVGLQKYYRLRAP